MQLVEVLLSRTTDPGLAADQYQVLAARAVTVARCHSSAHGQIGFGQDSFNLMGLHVMEALFKIAYFRGFE
jgi:hypothetical protein